MQANESDAHRRNEEFIRRLEFLCGEKRSRVPPFPDILDNLRKDQDVKKESAMVDEVGSREERIFGSAIDRDGYFSYV